MERKETARRVLTELALGCQQLDRKEGEKKKKDRKTNKSTTLRASTEPDHGTDNSVIESIPNQWKENKANV